MLVAHREETWMDRKTDFRQWDHLARAYGETFSFHDAWDRDDQLIVALDEHGDVDLSEFDHPDGCTYLFGRSCFPVTGDIVVRITTVEQICLFGVVAAGIVMHDRQVKRGR